MNDSDPDFPLVSVATQNNHYEDMLAALEEGDADALESTLTHLSPEDLNLTYTYQADGVFGLEDFDIPPNIRDDFSSKDKINICPVHYAVMKGDKRCLEKLLNAGANPNAKDSLGQTPLHVLLRGGWNESSDFQECLDVLLRCQNININLLDLSKTPPLGRVRESEKSYIIRRLGELGGTTVIIDLSDVLFKEILESNLEIFKAKLEEFTNNGLDNTILDESQGSYTLLQYASRCGLFEFVEVLLRHGASPTKKHDGNISSPVLWATKYGYHRIVKKLIQAMTDRDFLNGSVRERNEKKETPLHLAVTCANSEKNADVNYYRCLQILLEKKHHLDLDALNDDGNTALHFAALCNDVRAFSALLKEGANCTIANVFGVTALQCIRKEEMLTVLDNCIEYSTEKKVIDTDFWVKLNYEMMNIDVMKRKSGNREMTFLNFLAKVFQDKDILDHPLVQIIVYLKWQNVKKFFFLNLAFHTIFLSLLIIYISIYHSSLAQADEKATGYDASRIVFVCLILVTLFIREVMQVFMVKKLREYVSRIKNITEVITAVLAILLLCTPFNPAIKMGIAAWLILISLLEFILHLGRMPLCAVYITMFRAVAWNFFKFICLFSLIIFAFSFSFYLIFQMSDDFRTFPESLLKTIIMTTGEIDYGELPVKSFPVTSQILMTLFVFMILLVLVNLLNGLAISDIQDIQKRAEVISSVSLIDRMAQLEKAFYTENMCNPFKRILDYFFTVTLVFKTCLPKHHLFVYICQGAQITYRIDCSNRPVICECHSNKLQSSHIKALKEIVMKKKSKVH